MDLSRYARQMICPHVGHARQCRLAQSRVAIAGCGALGCQTASLLTRAGVGALRLIDRDFVELNNLQRQVLYDEEDVRSRTPKAAAAAAHLQGVNSQVKIEGVVADLTSMNVAALLGDVDLVLDAVDNFETRYLINDFCVSTGTPWIYGGVVGSYGLTMNILPGRTPCLRCLLPEAPEPGAVDTCDTAGILAPVVSVVGAVQVTEAMKMLTGAYSDLRRGLLSVEVWDGEMQTVEVSRRSDCATCMQRDYTYLNAANTSRTVTLCGRDAVQISLHGAPSLDLADLAARLRNCGEVTENAHLLRFTADPYELNIFSDARAIIKGTTDATVARTLYAKYVGL